MRMMMMNTETLSVHERDGHRQANNLLASQLSDAVRPWFADWNEPSITRAIEDLKVPALREDAARFLGLSLVAAA